MVAFSYTKPLQSHRVLTGFPRERDYGVQFTMYMYLHVLQPLPREQMKDRMPSLSTGDTRLKHD